MISFLPALFPLFFVPRRREARSGGLGIQLRTSVRPSRFSFSPYLEKFMPDLVHIWYRGVYGYPSDPSRFWWPWRNIQGHYEEICFWVRKSRLRDISRNICLILFIFDTEVYMGTFPTQVDFGDLDLIFKVTTRRYVFELENLVCAISQEIFARFCSCLIQGCIWVPRRLQSILVTLT